MSEQAKCTFCDGLGGWIAAADPMHAGKWQRCGSCDGSGQDTPIVAADLPERPDESEWVEPASADVPAHLDCPTCPKCGRDVAVGIKEIAWWRGTDPAHRLYCPACGHTWTGTDAEVEQAARADAAFDAMEAGC